MAGFYRGMSLPLAGTIVETSVLFSTNGALKRFLREAGHIGPDADLPMPYVMMSGAGTGFVVSWVLTPIELVKCRLQVPPPGTAPAQRYKGPYDCLMRSIRSEGLRVMYRGHVGTMLREVPGTMCWFGAYETFVRWMTPTGMSRSDLHPSTIVVAGALGGMSYWTIMYPCDTVKSAMQITSTMSVAAAAGATAPSCGHVLTTAAPAASAAPSSIGSGGGSLNSAFGSGGSGLSGNLPPKSRPIAAGGGGATTSVCGGAGGGPLLRPSPVAAFSTSIAAEAPTAAAQLRHASTSSSAVATGAPSASRLPHISQSFSQSFISIYRALGWRGLYAGLTPTLLRAAPSNAAIFLVYEYSLKELRLMAGEP